MDSSHIVQDVINDHKRIILEKKEWDLTMVKKSKIIRWESKY